MRFWASIIIGTVFFLNCITETQARTTYAINGTDDLTSSINHLVRVNDPNASVGIAIKSMKYGDTLYAKNEKSLFVPASTLKILTAQAALLYLGPNFTFTTRFMTDAKTITNGTLYGNVYLVHSGDPSLTFYDLADLIMELKSKQVREITGNVYIDNTAYDQINFGPGWVWNDKKYCYAAPINASIINHNCSSFRGKASSIAAHAVTNPRFHYGAIRNAVRSHRHKQYHYAPTPAGSSVVTDIIDYDRRILQDLFHRLGVQIDGSIAAGAAPPELPALATHQSKPLTQLITTMLKKSDNIIAGSLFKKIGQIYTRRPGSWANGGTAVTEILSQQTSMDIMRMNVIDGSGLSRYNQVSPAQMMQVLDFAYHHNATNYELISALPIAGVDGTLKHRLQNIAWKVRAKTGTMSGVRSLAGFTVSADKEPLAFVIMVNGRSGASWRYKELEDKIVTLLTHYSRKG